MAQKDYRIYSYKISKKNNHPSPVETFLRLAIGSGLLIGFLLAFGNLGLLLLGHSFLQPPQRSQRNRNKIEIIIYHQSNQRAGDKIPRLRIRALDQRSQGDSGTLIIETNEMQINPAPSISSRTGTENGSLSKTILLCWVSSDHPSGSSSISCPSGAGGQSTPTM